MEAAAQAAQQPASRDIGALLQGRAGLEYYRQTVDAADLGRAREALRSVNASALSARDRIDLVIGLAETLYLDNAPGAAADLFFSVIDVASHLETGAREQLLDWWATSVDRHAQQRPPDERSVAYERLADEMWAELKRNPTSASASYWVVLAAHNLGDFERAWDAAVAGWVRAQLSRAHAGSLRPDIDRLMTEAIIPDRAARLVASGVETDLEQVRATLTAVWDRVKSTWSDVATGAR
jgi:hypothetical protein